MLAVVIAFIAIIGGFKYFQIKKAMAGMSYQPPPEAVTTVVARRRSGTPRSRPSAPLPRCRASRSAPICRASSSGSISIRDGR